MNKYIVKKEFKESLYENKGIWMMFAATIVLSALCFLVTNIKEGAVLAQSDILGYAIKAELFLTLTISMVLGASAFASEREENTLESLLLTPISKWNLTFGKFLGVMVVGVLLLVISIPYLIAIGLGSGLVLDATMILLLCGLMLLIAFTSIAIGLSIIVGNSKASILASVLMMIILTFPAFVQGLFKLSPIGTFLLKFDPMAGCFNMMSAILMDRRSFLSQMNNIIPIVVFMVIGVGFMIWTSKKVALKGEK
ncbi:ABC transporter permease [Haloimpatiens lingqiaonensis]|uniref:ABC transporter permease n=1 Tax=Haloimpatiens lingqiaonensis TaxID=1380675 RepID=UPI00148534F8|nr:ABC transporter permease subunit [Haloimpatiens lingqiaonensis]MDD4432113.1 ABC transporter permease subunit [Parabacteroides sp.]